MPKQIDYGALAPYTAGASPLDTALARIALKARGDVSVVGGGGGSQVAPQSPAIANVARNSGIPARQPSLAEQLFMNATVFQVPKAGDPVPSISPSGGNWISLSDLPTKVQAVLRQAIPQGYGVAGFDLNSVKDPKQLELLNSWVSMGQREKDAQHQQAMANDPNYRAKILAAGGQ